MQISVVLNSHRLLTYIMINKSQKVVTQ